MEYTHIMKTIQKAAMSLGRCRRMCGKNWGLNPKMTLWLYTRVVRPMITYGSVAWWTKTQQVGTIRLLNNAQRLACLCITGALKTTPTAAIEVLLNLPPLHIFIQGEARSVMHRLIHNQQHVSKTHNADNRKLIKELKTHNIMGQPIDATATRYSFHNKFNVIIPDREDWKKGVPIQAEAIWYTDGSKTSEGVGAGVVGIKQGIALPVCLSKDVTIFQAEITAIHYCVEEIIRQERTYRSIAIFTDSQAALRALNSIEVNSKLVWDCVSALNKLGERSKVTLAWVPGHEGHKGNEKADAMAKQGASMSFVGPEPFCGVAKAITKAVTKKWLTNKSLEWWKNSPGQRQAKKFITEHSPKFTADLISKDRKSVKAVVGLLTGHCKLNRHLKLMGLAEEAMCRFCKSQEETAEHILCQCDSLAYVRFLVLGDVKPQARSYMEGSISRLLDFVKRVRLENVI